MSMEVIAPFRSGERDLTRVYRAVNDAWGGHEESRVLTFEEGHRAAVLLWRAFMPKGRKKWPYKFRFTSGNRYTQFENMVLKINPERGGWGHLVHAISHKVHAKTAHHTRRASHDPSHAYLERRMIEHVIAKGWLSGSLKKVTQSESPKPKPDLKAIRHGRALAALKRWRTKKKRAETAIKKLERQVRHYERQPIRVIS